MYRSPNIVRVIKSRRWAGHVAKMEEGRSAVKILTDTHAGKRPLGRTILEWALKRWVSMRVIGLILLGIGIIGEPCECGIEPTGSISHGVS